MITRAELEELIIEHAALVGELVRIQVSADALSQVNGAAVSRNRLLQDAHAVSKQVLRKRSEIFAFLFEVFGENKKF